MGVAPLHGPGDDLFFPFIPVEGVVGLGKDMDLGFFQGLAVNLSFAHGNGRIPCAVKDQGIPFETGKPW